MYKNTANYQLHMRTYHRDGLRRNYCDKCDLKFKQISGYVIHMQRFHNVVKPTITKQQIIYPDKEPDINDPNFYCAPCDVTSADKSKFRSHLRYIHNINLSGTVKSRILYPDRIPDPYDPKFFCNACEYTFKNKFSLRKHLHYIHHITGPFPDKTPDKQDTVSQTRRCKDCKHTFSTYVTYREHMLEAHDVTVPLPPPKKRKMPYPYLKPDEHDPNNYCCACDRTYSNVANYRLHLALYHKIKGIAKRDKEKESKDTGRYCSECNVSYLYQSTYLSHVARCHPEFNSGAEIKLPSVDYNQLYCSVCDKTYCNRSSYRKHLVEYHKMNVPKLPTKCVYVLVDQDDEMVNNPDMYCRICERKYANKHSFKLHLVTIHGVPYAKFNHFYNYLKPDEEPDIDDPNDYCNPCKKKYCGKSSYQKHLIRVHNIFLPTIKHLHKHLKPNAKTINSNKSNGTCDTNNDETEKLSEKPLTNTVSSRQLRMEARQKRLKVA